MRGIKSSIQMHSHSFDALNDAKLLQFLVLRLIFLVFFLSELNIFLFSYIVACLSVYYKAAKIISQYKYQLIILAACCAI